MTDHQIQGNEQSMKQDAMTHLLLWLSPDKEQAGQLYERLRRKLIELFARKGVPNLTLPELADETLDRVGRKLAEGEVIRNPEPMAYVHGVAVHVLSEFWRKQTRKTKHEINIDDLSPRDLARVQSTQRPQNQQEEKEIWQQCIDEFLKSLPPEDEALLRKCYQDDQRQQSANRRQAAKRMGLAENSLRVYLHRIRQTLQRKVRACVERSKK